jgi:cytochrome c oxidase cbb3-type subunit 3
LTKFPVRGRLGLAVAAATFIFIGFSSISRGQTADQTNPADENVEGTRAAIQGSHEDPTAVARGETLYRANCGTCHGMTAKGTGQGADLIRSPLLIDDDNGNLLTPVIRDGEPDKGMPKSTLTADQISDVVAWLHVQFYAADHRTTYAFRDILTGDPQKGEAYFNGAAKCSTCHSVTGDLAGIGAKYDPHALQQRWLDPRSGFGRGRGFRGGAAASANPDMRGVTTVTVTLPNGKSFSAPLDRIDDFFVSLRDSSGALRTFPRSSPTDPKVVINDPLKVHVELLRTYTDAEVHDITAYLATLK